MVRGATQNLIPPDPGVVLAPVVTAGVEEIDIFRRAYPQTRFVDVLIADLAGTPRGKRVRMDQLRSVYEGDFLLPGSMFAMAAPGMTVEATGLGLDDGDADRRCLPLEGSLLPVPWRPEGVAQVQVSMRDHDDRPFFGDPRCVLARVVERFHQLGLYPVVAVELEFYLLDQQRTSDGSVQPPVRPSNLRREYRTQSNSMAAIDGFSAVLAEIDSSCEAQKVPGMSAIAECGPGQYEINLRHVADPCLACDYAIRLKRIVQGVALRHGMQATFMAKPYADASGSGSHLHVSLLDEAGHNVFASEDPRGSSLLRHAIGGLAATMMESMLIFAPTINSFRRYRPESFVPLSPAWGVNNRSVALRIPVSSAENRRVEHRVAGADTNPYLLTAAVLAGMRHGIDSLLEPGPCSVGNAYQGAQATLPTNWPSALAAFENSQFIREHLGAEFQRLFATTRRAEFQNFESLVTPTEFDWYLSPG